MSTARIVANDIVEVFHDAARNQIANLDACLQDITTAPETWDSRKEEARGIVHDLKGQGASFGYPLVTSVGQSLLSFLRSLERADTRSMKVAIVHVHVLRTVLEKDIQGTGGIRGDRLVEHLKRLTTPAP